VAIVEWLLIFGSGILLAAAGWRTRTTTLGYALAWAGAAWLVASWVAWARLSDRTDPGRLEPYLALCLAGCAGVAVLGARRPGHHAWNFVLLGLLVVLLLPAAEGFGEPRLRGPYVAFLAGTLVVAVLNYLPTRLGLAAALAACGWGLELADLLGSRPVFEGLPSSGLFLGLAPWAAAISLATRLSRGRSEFDRTWLSFRDAFGTVWAQRVREQFNRAAANAQLPIELEWRGLRGSVPVDAERGDPALTILRALLKRFTTGAEGADE
jgi:hypothetical protein